MNSFVSIHAVPLKPWLVDPFRKWHCKFEGLYPRMFNYLRIPDDLYEKTL